MLGKLLEGSCDSSPGDGRGEQGVKGGLEGGKLLGVCAGKRI